MDKKKSNLIMLGLTLLWPILILAAVYSEQQRECGTVIIAPQWARENNMLALIEITPASYVVGERGTIFITIKNIGEYEAKFDSVEVQVPKEFVQGFLIAYPTKPDHQEIKSTFLTGSKVIVFKLSNSLGPNETYKIEIPIAANTPGYYSGKYKASVELHKCSNNIGSFEDVQMRTLVILPANE